MNVIDDPHTFTPEHAPNFPPSGAAWIEGQIMPIAEARIPILDWGFIRGDATYDVAHTWGGRFFRLEEHLDRFWNGVERLRYKLPVDRADVRRILDEVVAASGLENAYVAMIATRGTPRPGSRDPRHCRNQFYAFAIPFIWIADPEKQKTGLNMAISDIHRIAPEAVDPTVKNYHWLDFQVALLAAYDAGYETAILTDTAGNVCEGPGFNIFVVKDGRLATPETGVLEGVTRKTVMELAELHQMPCEVRPVHGDEVRGADEVFITSTAGGIMPITRIEGIPVGSGDGAGRPGEVYRRLHEAYWRMHG